MGYQKCITEIQNAASGRLTDADLEALLDEIIKRARRNENRQTADAEKFKQAAAEMSKDVETALAIEKRNKIIDLEKRVARRDFYKEAVAQTGDIALAIESRINGVNTPLAGGRRSAEAITLGLRRQWLGGMVVDLDRAGVTRAFQSDALVNEWAMELAELNKGDKGTPGISGSKPAQQIAEILYKYQRAAVDSLNREGAWVRDYFGYVSRTSHDPDKVHKAGREQWIRDVMDGLDVERTFGGDAREALKALADLWIDFKDGNHLRFDDALEGVAFPGMNFAKKASAQRVLHWRDSNAWVAYSAKYGNGPARQIMIEGLDRAARASALMQVYGSNPRAAFEADIEWARTEFRGENDRVRAFNKRAKALDNRFSILDGTANMPVNRTLAAATSWALGGQRWSKLGGASVSAILDLATKASELRYQGVGFFEQWSGGFTGYLRGRGSKERKEIADLLLAGLESRMGQMHLRFDVADATPGTVARIDNAFFKLTGLTAMTVNQRTDFEVILAAHLGRQQDRAWGKLRPETQRAFKMAGVTPEHWEMLRGVQWNEAAGRTYLTPDVAKRLDDAAVAAHLRSKGKLASEPVAKDFDDAFAGARKARMAAEERYANSAAAANEPDAYAPFREVARGLSNVAQRDFEIHGIIANPELGLRQALDRGSASGLKAAKPRPGSDGLSAPYVLLSDKGKSLGETGIKNVVLNGPGEKFKAKLADLYPDVNFLTPQEARRFMEGGDLPQRPRPGYAPENVKAKVDAFKADLATTLAAFYADRGTYAVLETGVRERAVLTQGTRPGSPAGIAARLFTQFKGFPTAMITRAWGREIYGGQGRMGAVSGIVQLLVSSTMLGYAAMVAKDVIKGREPRVPDPNDLGKSAAVFAAAFMQGGALGIYGDFLFGKFNRHGRDLLATALGPTASTANDLASVLAAYRDGDDATAKAFKLAVDNAPGGNIWWAKTALDHLVLYQIQEMLNPGSVRRMERAVERNNDQKFWLSPSESVR